MRLLEVIPISGSNIKDTLSYFSATDVESGSFVKIPLRKKIVPAIVVSSKNIEDAKFEIKNSPYELRKIEKLKSYNFLRKEFIETAIFVGDYFVGSTGQVLNLMVPKIFFEIAADFKNQKVIEEKSELTSEKFLIQTTDDDRFSHYKSIIREEFAKGLSVFFCLPTVQDIKKASESLQKGIESYTYTFHSGHDKKEIRKNINNVLVEEHPVLIIATAPYLSIPKEKIGTIIVDRESSRSYKLQKSPYLDARVFAEQYAKLTNKKIIFGDMLLRAETVQRFKNGELVELLPLKFRSLTSSSQEIIDMKEEVKNPLKKEFKIFSEKLVEQIRENLENNEHMFIFAARRGLSPSTICADCETIVKCNMCGAHTILHKSKENFFLCHKCGERRNADEKCKNCGSWRLTTLGIGSEFVEEKIKEMFPEANVFRIDADASASHSSALKIAEKFYAAPQGILVGTEMALLYLTTPIQNTAVISMDTFFSIPDFRVNERILNILLKIRSITNKKFIIQTRDAKQNVFEYAVRGNLIDFFKYEIDDRKMLSYPPFSTLIKISVTGSKDEVIAIGEKLTHLIKPYEMDVFPAFIPSGAGKFTMNGIIKITDSKWPDKELISKLKSLPLNVIINVDPDSLI